MNESFKEELIAPCGMNCSICIAFFGYTMNGQRRKIKCIGCKLRDKNCAFLKKHCKKISKKEIQYCYECDEFPCSKLEKLDKGYQKRYDMSMIENLKMIKNEGFKKFLKQQKEKYSCPICGGVICVHNKICYNCKK